VCIERIVMVALWLFIVVIELVVRMQQQQAVAGTSMIGGARLEQQFQQPLCVVETVQASVIIVSRHKHYRDNILGGQLHVSLYVDGVTQFDNPSRTKEFWPLICQSCNVSHDLGGPPRIRGTATAAMSRVRDLVCVFRGIKLSFCQIRDLC
jgi:hypothetical protein